MSDGKTKKNSWFSWLIIGIAFVVVVVVLLLSFLKEGKATATMTAEDTLLSSANVWASQLGDTLSMAEKTGGMIDDYITDKGRGGLTDDTIYLMDKVVKNTPFYRVMVHIDGKKPIDDEGKSYNDDLYDSYLEEESTEGVSYTFIKDDGMGKDNVVMVSYPITSCAGHILFFLDIEELGDIFTAYGYEDASFAVLFKKDGTILTVLPGFTDKDSKFLTQESFLMSIQDGTKREDYNFFKAKLYNGAGCFIQSTYKSDSRTIVCVPVKIEDWYLGYGVRQYKVDIEVDSAFRNLKNTVIELVVVLGVFALVAIGFAIYTATKSRERGRKLEDKADMDLLTELTNKAATERMISDYIDSHPNGHGVLFILDIDNFKKVNDTMGHAFGDTLLKTLGKEIRTEFRVTDIVGRTGGDEFMIFLKDINDDLIVEREANRITRFFHDFKAGGDYVKYSATASIGCAIYPSDGATFKDLYVSADQALYRAKKRGKNQLIFYNEDKYGNNKA